MDTQHDKSAFMPSVIMLISFIVVLNVIMLSVVMLNVVMLSAIMLSVVVPSLLRYENSYESKSFYRRGPWSQI